MKKQHTSLVTLGITSLFLIFAVLCMVILSLLTLSSSRSDLRMSLNSMEQTTAYYDACTAASGLCLQAETFLNEIYGQVLEEDAYFTEVSGLEAQGFVWDADSRTLSFDTAFSDSQALHVELNVYFPQNSKEPLLEICTWQTISIGTWTPDTKQSVYIKETTP